MMKKVSTAATTMNPPQIMYAFGPSIPLFGQAPDKMLYAKTHGAPRI